MLAILVFGCSREGPAPACKPAASPDGDWFVEVTGEVGLSEGLATSVVAGDLDGDGWTDLYASVFLSQREPSTEPRTRFLFMNRGGVFVDELETSGLLATRDGQGGRGLTVASMGDLDNDGDLDVVGCPAEISTTILDGCAAFLNDGTAHFTLASGGDLEATLFSSPSSVLLDHDLDGRLDLWPATVGEWQYGPAATSPPRLFRGQGDGSFVEVSEQVGLPPERTTPDDLRTNFGLTSCDLDVDGDRDVLVGQYGVPLGPNHVWRNEGGSFVDVASAIGVDRAEVGGFTCAITCGDLDDDGDPDLMTSEIAHPGQGTDTSAVLLQHGPDRFERIAPEALGMGRSPGEREGDEIALIADLDLDGHKDVIWLSANYPQQHADDTEYTHASVFRQVGPLSFLDVTSQTPFGDPRHQSLEGPALLDYDRDGDLDLAVGTGLFNGAYIAKTHGLDRHALRLYRNEVGQDHNWTRIRLVGAGEGASNRSAIGARVAVSAGGRTQHQEVLGSWGHSNTQGELTLTFGLGSACTVDMLEIHWPDAQRSVTRHEHVLANQLVQVSQGDPELVYLDP